MCVALQMYQISNQTHYAICVFFRPATVRVLAGLRREITGETGYKTDYKYKEKSQQVIT